jgi:hypothetical protein
MPKYGQVEITMAAKMGATPLNGCLKPQILVTDVRQRQLQNHDSRRCHPWAAANVKNNTGDGIFEVIAAHLS